jgi:hypothetical protein
MEIKTPSVKNFELPGSFYVAQTQAMHFFLALNFFKPRYHHKKRILGFPLARLSKSGLARSASRRCMMVTLLAKLVRNRASSIALSPPPTTCLSFPR